MRAKKEHYGDARDGRRRFVEGLEARRTLSAATNLTGIVVSPQIVMEVPSFAVGAQGIGATGQFQTRRGDPIAMALVGGPFFAFDPFDSFHPSGVPVAPQRVELVEIADLGRALGSFGPPASTVVIAAPPGGVALVVSGTVATPAPAATVMTAAPISHGLEPQARVVPPSSQAISPLVSNAAGAASANTSTAPVEIRGDDRSAASVPSVAPRVITDNSPAIAPSAAKSAMPAWPNLDAELTPAHEPTITGAASALTGGVSSHPGGVVLAPLTNLVAIASATPGGSTLFADTPLKLVEPVMTTLPGLLLGLAPAPATAVAGKDPARGWEIAAAVSLGVGIAGYWYTSRAEREARESAAAGRPEVRRIRDGWELLPMEPR